MSNSIQSATLQAFKSGRSTKVSSKGWHTGNAPCCIHNGEGADKRGRGGLILGDSGEVSWHCFNCQYKASYTPGYPMSWKFRKLLKWLGLDDNELQRLVIEAMREQQRQEMLGLVKLEPKKEELKISFKKESLPAEADSFMNFLTFYTLSNDYPDDFLDSIKYISDRKVDMQKYDIYWTPVKKFGASKRVIVPFTWKNEIIGYTARDITDSQPLRYIQHIDSGYVFNVDKQEKDWKFVIVVEGVFDALAIDGVAILGAGINQQQIDIIESLEREIIVVPDRDKTGSNLIDIAIANGWNVAFPDWYDTCKDANKAVQEYGKLFTLKAILDSVERSELKIKLMKKQYFKNTR